MIQCVAFAKQWPGQGKGLQARHLLQFPVKLASLTRHLHRLLGPVSSEALGISVSTKYTSDL
jgi:hypothetical protein